MRILCWREWLNCLFLGRGHLGLFPESDRLGCLSFVIVIPCTLGRQSVGSRLRIAVLTAPLDVFDLSVSVSIPQQWPFDAILLG